MKEILRAHVKGKILFIYYVHIVYRYICNVTLDMLSDLLHEAIEISNTSINSICAKSLRHKC